MKATRQLHDAGQSIWLDNITRARLTSGGLERYVDELSVTGLTSNPTIFEQAIKSSDDYDEAIRAKTAAGRSGEELFFELALADLTQAADLFLPIHQATNGVDGWVSLEVSPRLAHDTPSTVAAAKDLHARAARPNLFIKIPGTPEGVPAIEEAIFAGVPLRLLNAGARPQRLLWASTGTKDPEASDVLYVEALAAPHSVNTIPEKTLHAFADHGSVGAMLPHDGGDAEEVLGELARAGVDHDRLAADVQRQGAAAFVTSWDELLACIDHKSARLAKAG